MKIVHVTCRRWWCTFSHLIMIFYDTLHHSIVTLELTISIEERIVEDWKEGHMSSQKAKIIQKNPILVPSSPRLSREVFLFILSCFDQQVIFTFLTTSINLINEIDPSNFDSAWTKFSSFLKKMSFWIPLRTKIYIQDFPILTCFFFGTLHSDNRDMSPYFSECQVLVAVHRSREVRQLLRKTHNTKMNKLNWTEKYMFQQSCWITCCRVVVYQASRLTFTKSSDRTWLVLI